MIYRDNTRYTWGFSRIVVIISFVLGLVFSVFAPVAKLGHFLLIGSIFGGLVLFLVWAFRFKLFKFGLKKSMEMARLVDAIQVQLLDAHIFLERSKSDNGVVYVDLPRIKIDWENEPVVQIANSINFHAKFDSLDFSAGFLNYAVESSYFSDDENWLVLELHNYGVSRRFVFDDFQKFSEKISSIPQNKILVDKSLQFKYSHILIVGQTGSGKSYFTETLLLEWLLHGVSLSIADPKNADLSVLGETVGADVATDFKQIAKLINDFYSQMVERMKIVHEKLKLDPNKTAFDFGLQEHYLIIDEYGAFAAVLQRQKKADRDKIMGQLQEIIFQGRQCGFYVCLITQQVNATILPTAIRDNLGFRIALGQNDRTTLQTAFGESTEIPKKKMRPGNGWYVANGQNMTPKMAETPTLKFNILRAFKSLKSKRSA